MKKKGNKRHEDYYHIYLYTPVSGSCHTVCYEYGSVFHLFPLVGRLACATSAAARGETTHARTRTGRSRGHGAARESLYVSTRLSVRGAASAPTAAAGVKCGTTGTP